MLRTMDEAAIGLKGSSSLPPVRLIAAYGACALAVWGVFEAVAERHFACVLTVSVMIQLFAFVLLAMQAASRQCLFIAPEMLVLCACGLCLRLSSTLWLNGYLPVDATGDFVFQATDLCSLLLVLWLLASAYSEGSTAKRREESGTTLPLVPVILGACIAVALVMHGDMNSRPLFDSTWLAGLLLDCVAVAPQLQLIARSKGRVDALTSHFMAAMALSRVCALVFFWEAWYDITCVPYVADVNHTMWTIFVAHLVHFALIADFGYYYVKAALTHGLGNSQVLQTWHSI